MARARFAGNVMKEGARQTVESGFGSFVHEAAMQTLSANIEDAWHGHRSGIPVFDTLKTKAELVAGVPKGILQDVKNTYEEMGRTIERTKDSGLNLIADTQNLMQGVGKTVDRFLDVRCRKAAEFMGVERSDTFGLEGNDFKQRNKM